MTNNQIPSIQIMINNQLPNSKQNTFGNWSIGKLVIICILVIGYWLFGCSLRKPATAITADTLTRGMAAVESEEDVFVARESALPLIKILDVLHYGDPKNKKFLGLLAKAYGNYAFGFAELENLDRAKTFYLKGRDFGVSALSTGKKPITDIPLDKFENYLQKFGKKDVPSLFWTAFSWGSYINMSRDDIIAAADLPRVEMMIKRIIEIDPEFECGIPYAMMGVLTIGNPMKTLGTCKKTTVDGLPLLNEPTVSQLPYKDLSGCRLAEKYFEDAMSKCSGNYLMTRVMYAQWYAKAVGDEKLFKETLQNVISADSALLLKHRLANELAKERAAVLLKH